MSDISVSGAGNESANITKTNNKESNGLDEKVNKIMVLPKGDIVAPTEEKISADRQLQNMQPDNFGGKLFT